ncbi:hypothetical protein BaRGS_00019600 [Batillaria attramentaria]|uniref:Protein-lysine methyltransferase METTL21D n=1 Tax=Batillaria attramentaria TaxID=370345 RepID=A0ABD0KQS5_9CAEN
MAAPIDLTKLFVREYEKKDGTVLKFHQSEIGDVGCVVWDAALVLSRYLETADFSDGRDLESKTVIELGSGTGAVGLVAASFGANVIVTDLPEFVPLMEFNIRANAEKLRGKMEARPLTWGHTPSEDFPASPDYILIADCIYYEESLEPLVKTAQSLCRKQTRLLCCYEKRDTGNKPELERRFFELAYDAFDVERIPTERHDQQFCSDDILIFKFKLKNR